MSKMKYQMITDEAEALAAVRQDGYALQYVQAQTEPVCLAAVKQYGHALQFVRDEKLFEAIAKEVENE